MSWYEGPWRVIPERSLEEKPRLKPGEILQHQSGSVILCCPRCGAMQFAQGPVDGSPEKPTVKTPVVCGSGYCQRCGETEPSGRFVPTCFAIIQGKAVKAERYQTKSKIAIPNIKGVKPPPKIGG